MKKYTVIPAGLCTHTNTEMLSGCTVHMPNKTTHCIRISSILINVLEFHHYSHSADEGRRDVPPKCLWQTSCFQRLEWSLTLLLKPLVPRMTREDITTSGQEVEWVTCWHCVLFTGVSSPSQVTRTKREVHRQDRIWNNEAWLIHCSVMSFQTWLCQWIPSSCLKHFNGKCPIVGSTCLWHITWTGQVSGIECIALLTPTQGVIHKW